MIDYRAREQSGLLRVLIYIQLTTLLVWVAMAAVVCRAWLDQREATDAVKAAAQAVVQQMEAARKAR